MWTIDMHSLLITEFILKIDRLVAHDSNGKIVAGYGSVIQHCRLRELNILSTALTPADANRMKKIASSGKVCIFRRPFSIQWYDCSAAYPFPKMFFLAHIYLYCKSSFVAHDLHFIADFRVAFDSAFTGRDNRKWNQLRCHRKHSFVRQGWDAIAGTLDGECRRKVARFVKRPTWRCKVTNTKIKIPSATLRNILSYHIDRLPQNLSNVLLWLTQNHYDNSILWVCPCEVCHIGLFQQLRVFTLHQYLYFDSFGLKSRSLEQ